MYLFSWINSFVTGYDTGPNIRATVWAPVQNKVAVISILVNLICTRSIAESFMLVSLRLSNKIQAGPSWATVWGPMGPHAKRKGCHWYSYVVTLVWINIQPIRSIYLFSWIKKIITGNGTGPNFRATVWAPVQDKVAVISILVNLICTRSILESFMLVSLRLNKHIFVGAFQATVWGPVQAKLAVIASMRFGMVLGVNSS